MSQYELSDLTKAIGECLQAALPLEFKDKIIKADDRGVRLGAPFATFKVISDAPASLMASLRVKNEPGVVDPSKFKRIIEETRNAVVSINIYGRGAMRQARYLVMKFQDADVLYLASQKGIVFQSASGIRRLVENNLTTQEDRAQVDFKIQYSLRLDTESAVVEIIEGKQI